MKVLNGPEEIMKYERKVIFETVTKLSDVSLECEFFKDDIPVIINTLKILMESRFVENPNPINKISRDLMLIEMSLSKIANKKYRKHGKTFYRKYRK